MKNRGSTPILTNFVGVHPRNMHTKFKANLCSCLSSRRSRKTKKVHAEDNNEDDDGYRVIANHTHSLSMT